jgi:hypothetical protein
MRQTDETCSHTHGGWVGNRYGFEAPTKARICSAVSRQGPPRPEPTEQYEPGVTGSRKTA